MQFEQKENPGFIKFEDFEKIVRKFWPKAQFTDVDIIKQKFNNKGYILIEEFLQECKLKGRFQKDKKQALDSS